MRRRLVVRSWILLVCAALAVIMLPATSADAATRTMKVLVIPVHWGTKLDTRSSARKLISTDTGGWLSTVSRKRLRLSTTVAPVSKITAGCARVTERAEAAAVRKGYRLSRYDLVVVLAPTCARYSTERHANLTLHRHPAELTLYGKQGRSLSTATHQFGFLLGLDAEAKRYDCSVGGHPVTVAASKQCYHWDASADIDTMGTGTLAGSYAAPELEDLGWLKSSEVVKRRSGTATVRLAPLLGSGVRVIKARGKGATYWVEYRTRTGVDRRLDPASAGVRVWRSTDADNRLYGQRRYHVIDMVPASGAIDPLRPASTWTSPEGLAFTVRSVTAKAATVTVRFRAPKPKVPPAPRLTLAPGDDEAKASWTARGDGGRPVTRFEVQSRVGGGPWREEGFWEPADAASTTVGGENGRRLSVRIRARNDLGASAWTDASTTPTVRLPTVHIVSPVAAAVVDGRYLDVVVDARPHPVSMFPLQSVLIDVGNSGPEAIATQRPDGLWSASIDLTRIPREGTVAVHATSSDVTGRTGTDEIEISVPKRLSPPTLLAPTADPAPWEGDTFTVRVAPGVDRLTGRPASSVEVDLGWQQRLATAENGWTVTFDRSAVQSGGSSLPHPVLSASSRGEQLIESDPVTRAVELR